MDIKKKFIELTQYTEILGQENALKKHLPSNIKTDIIGNYYLKIGDSDTIFASHLDTAAHRREKVNHVFDRVKKKDGTFDYFIETDKKTLLGADDRAGVIIMLYMIEHNVPGLYYFFIGEESGLVGSSNILKEKPEFFQKYNKCISFDRRGYGSIITKQMGSKCCSNEFTNALIKEMNKCVNYPHENDPTGVYTDSAVFMDIIPECTNISVGYFNEHTTNEYQNITFLEKLCKGVINVDWENLPIKRDPKPLDTPNPKRKPKKDTDLSDKELGVIFNIIEDMLEETLYLDCVNRYNFIPEKEMLFQNELDDDSDILSVFIHEDGSITIGQDHFTDIYDLEDNMKTYYGYEPKSHDDYHNGDESPFIDDFEDDFEENFDISPFIDELLLLNKQRLSALEMNDILKKYNKSLDSLIIWIFNNNNDPNKTHGISWDDNKNSFVFNEKGRN